MREGPFDITTAVRAELVGEEPVVSINESVGDGTAELSELFTTVEAKLMALKEHPVCKILEKKNREDLTVPERFAMSNRAQASTFLRTAAEQMTKLEGIIAAGNDPSTHIAHIRQSLLITETRMAEALEAVLGMDVPNVAVEVPQDEVQEIKVEAEVPERERESLPTVEKLNPTTEIIDTITEALGEVTKRGKREQSRIEVSELERLRATLIALDKRYQNFAHGTHVESDKTVRDIIAAKTLSVIENTKREVETHLEGLKVRLASVPEEIVKTEPRIGWFTPGYAGRKEKVPAPEVVIEEAIPRGEVSAVAPEPIAPKVTPIIPEIPKGTVELEKTSKEVVLLAESYVQVLKDVRMLRKMPARIISGSKEFPEILASREASLLELEHEYATALEKNPDLVSQSLQAEVTKAKEELNPLSVGERLAAVTAKVLSRAPNQEGKKLKAEPPMETGVVLLEPNQVEQITDPFTHKNVIDASDKDVVLEEAKVEAMESLLEAVNQTVSVSEGRQNNRIETSRRESIPPVTTIESIKQFIQNYEGGKEAFQDSFESWVDTIQDVHPSRWRPIALFGSGEAHTDAFSHFKKMSVGEFRDIIKMPENARQAKLQSLQIQSEDFEKWRRELTLSAMVDGVRDSLQNPSTSFEDWARYSFAASKIAEQQFSA